MSRIIPAFLVLLLVFAGSVWVALGGLDAETAASTLDEPIADAGRLIVEPEGGEGDSIRQPDAAQADGPKDHAGTLEIALLPTEPGVSFVRWVLELSHRDRPEVRQRITGFEADGHAVSRIREPGWYSVASLEDAAGRSIWQRRIGDAEPWFELRAGERTRIQLRIRRSGMPVGRVAGFVLSMGRPAAGLVVSHDLPRRNHVVETDAQGRFDLGPVYRSEFDLRVDALHWAGHVHVEDGRQKQLFIDVSPGAIHGVVVDGFGRPLACKVRLTGELPPGPGYGAAKVELSTPAGLDGKFAADRLPPGVYRVVARNRLLGGGLRDIQVSTGVVREVRVVMRPARNLRGRLLIPWLDFKRHKTALLAFSGPVDELALLSPSGRFRIDDLVAGTYRVSLALGDFEEDFVEVELLPALLVQGDGSEPVELKIGRPKLEKLAETLHRFGFGLR